MTALVKREDDFEVAIRDIEQTQSICEKLFQMKHYQKIGAEGIYAIVCKARILGINPMDAVNGAIYVTNGKTELAANTMNYLIREAGHSITKDPKSDKTCCILHGRRKDNGDTWTVSFSIDDAKKAGIFKNVWNTYPEDMLFARALTRLARQLFADVIKGCYTEGEIIDNPRTSPLFEKPESKVESIEVKEVVIQPAAFQVRPEKPIPEPKKPTVEELTQLSEILDECDPAFVAEKKNALKKAFGSDDFKEMNVATYIRLLELAKKNKAEYFAKQMDGEDEPTEENGNN